MNKNVFLNPFKGKSIEDLNYIIRNKDRYTKAAVESAKQLLNSNIQSNSAENDSHQSEIIEEKKAETLREEEMEKENSKDKITLKKGQVIKIKIPEYIIKNEKCYISKWHVEIGEKIRQGQILCEIESENSTSSFESLIAGKISYINTSNHKLDKNSVIVEIVYTA